MHSYRASNIQHNDIEISCILSKIKILISKNWSAQELNRIWILVILRFLRSEQGYSNLSTAKKFPRFYSILTCFLYFVSFLVFKNTFPVWKNQIFMELDFFKGKMLIKHFRYIRINAFQSFVASELYKWTLIQRNALFKNEWNDVKIYRLSIEFFRQKRKFVYLNIYRFILKNYLIIYYYDKYILYLN